MTDHFSYDTSTLACDGIPLSVIANAHGTPTYVYSAAHFRERFRALDAALDDLPHTICYAVKANSNLAILSLFDELGAGFDIVSGGELFRIAAAGAATDNVVFAGVGKTRDEIRFALENKIHSFTVESAEELRAINSVAADAGTLARIAVRVNPDVDPQTHTYITTGKSENKFGLDFVAARELYRAAASLPNITAVGVQMHIGSQIVLTDPFVAALQKLRDFVAQLRADGVLITHVDIGGGLGIVYNNETPPSPGEFAAAIRPYLRELDAHVLLEPGRFLVGNGGVLLTRVVYVKQTPVKTFVITDAGMNDLMRPALYDAWHGILPVTLRGGEPQRVDIVGPVCETGDFYAQNRELPPLEPNDLLAVTAAGAYGFAMASNYNSRPRAAEVMIDTDSFSLIRRRETWDDLVAPERHLHAHMRS